MAERKKRGLGRGLGALIPDAASNDRPVDVFFSGGNAEEQTRGSGDEAKAGRNRRTDPAATMQSSRRRKPKGAAEGSETKSSASGTAKSGSRSTASSKAGTSGKSATTKSATSKTSAGKTAAAGKAAGAKSAASKPAAAKGAASKATASKAPASKATGSTTSKSASSAASMKTAGAKASGAKTTAVSATKRSSVASATFEGAESAAAAEQAAAVEETSAVDFSAANDDVREDHPGVFTSRGFSDDEPAADTSAETEKLAEEPASETGDVDVDTTYVVETSLESSGGGSSDGEAAVDADDVAEASGVDSIPDTAFGEIEVALVDPNPRQPRSVFDEDQLAELVHSIREIGVLQPVVVRRKPGEAERYELIMGERRLRASKEAGLETIPAIVRYVDDTDLLRDALLENLHRAELNPLEEAAAYGQLLEDFGCTQEELSERIGRSRPQISNTLRLLRLPPLVQRRVAAGVISAGHARAILGLKDPEQMEVLAQRIVAEGLSVRASEEAVVLLNRGDSVNVSRATSRVAPEFIEVAERLGDRLDTKVNITVGKRKGKLSVEFANQEDLDRILALLGVKSAE